MVQIKEFAMGDEIYKEKDGKVEIECGYPSRKLNAEPAVKPTNPKEGLGIKKVPTHCIPSGPLFELGLAMMEGGRKYGSHNYRAMGARASVYFDAIERHLRAWWEGEDIDPDSGLHHLVKIMGCCVVMRDSQMMGNDIDDRPIKYPIIGLDMNRLNTLAERVIEKYPECKKPYTERRN